MASCLQVFFAIFLELLTVLSGNVWSQVTPSFQFGNIGMGGANMSWDPSQLQGQGQPSTSGTQDGSQRVGVNFIIFVLG